MDGMGAVTSTLFIEQLTVNLTNRIRAKQITMAMTEPVISQILVSRLIGWTAGGLDWLQWAGLSSWID